MDLSHLWLVLVHSRAFHGALSGWAAAAVVDVHAFMRWQSFDEFASYGWRLAIWRWVQGFVSGAAIGAGYGALVN